MLGSIDHTTPIWFIAIGMALMGLGVGAMMQNLVLAVQNTVDVKDIGSTSASVAFFRSLGGALGVSVLGAVLADHVQKLIVDGLAALGISGSGSAPASLDLSNLPAPVVQIIRGAYGDATGLIFLIGAGAALALPDRGVADQGGPAAQHHQPQVRAGHCRPSRRRAGRHESPVAGAAAPRRLLEEPVGAGSRADPPTPHRWTQRDAAVPARGRPRRRCCGESGQAMSADAVASGSPWSRRPSAARR